VTEGTRDHPRVSGGIGTRAAPWLAWSLAGLAVATFAVAVVFAILSLIADPSQLAETVGRFVIILPFFSFPVVGLLIASRRPGNWIGWICLISGLFWTAFFENEASSAYELVRTGAVKSSVTLDALTQAVWVFPVGLLGIYMILLFPDGRLPSRRWRPFAWFAGAVMVLMNVIFALVPGPLENHPGVRNPFGLEQYSWLPGVAVAIVLMLPLCILVSTVSLVLRYRRSGREVREQIKWLAFAASFVGLMYFGTLISGLLLSPESYTTKGTPPLWISLSQLLTQISFASVPIAIGVAVLKYRLYDIEIIINRALVYGSLTAILAGIYFGGVTATQALLSALTDQQELSQLVVVASTLVIAALFTPLRRSIQSIIDRSFYRRKYDAAKTLEAFSMRLRDETDLETVRGDLLGVVRETMQPVYVSVWLRPGAARERPRG
jgi:hypothetical protein